LVPWHYVWAGLDFIVPDGDLPVLLDANKASHMLWEYLLLYRSDLPFRILAARLKGSASRPCFLLRRSDRPPGEPEDAAFVLSHVARHLDRPPHICYLESQANHGTTLLDAEGETVEPDVVFRWWYPLRSAFEHAGALVINSNALWTIVRDKMRCYRALQGAAAFRVPESYAVDNREELALVLSRNSAAFADGYVVKPRIGWGGHRVQVCDGGDLSGEVGPHFMVSQRIRPARDEWAPFWDVRAFVINGEFAGAVQYNSHRPVTNYHQGGLPTMPAPHVVELVRQASLEAVARIEKLASICTVDDDDPVLDVTF